MNYSLFDFYQLNYLLIVIAKLSKYDKYVQKKILIYECLSHILGARRYNYEKALKLALLFNLISERNNRIYLSKPGREFLISNPNNYYELTDNQKEFIINNYLLSGVFSSASKELFSIFLPDYENETYYFNLDEDSFPKEKEPILTLSINIGIINKDNSLLVVKKAFVGQIAELLGPEIKISSKKLLEKMRYQIKLGEYAENLVLKYEKERLEKMNKPIQSNLVRKISSLNSSAGYDIESFNGNNSDIEFNRFIEVKACSENRIRFYWTRNEYNVALKLKNKYWIYFVNELHLQDIGPISPIMFKNPINMFGNNKKYNIEPYVYLIEKN